MARIRSIKPEFTQSESIGRLSRDARLLFILLWTIVDDEGRARAASRMLASLLFPYDDDAPKKMDGWLTELEEENLIRLYEVEGSQYLDIPKWLKHQKIDHPSGSRLPAFAEASREPREDSRSLAPDLGPRTLDLGPRIKNPSESVGRDATRLKNTKNEFEEFKRAYPKRKGPNPWSPARKQFEAALKQGATADEIIAALRAGVGFDREKIGTEYTPQAVKWLRDRRWEDYQPNPDAPKSTGPPPGAPSDDELRRKYSGNGNGNGGLEKREATGPVEDVLRPGEAVLPGFLGHGVLRA